MVNSGLGSSFVTWSSNYNSVLVLIESILAGWDMQSWLQQEQGSWQSLALLFGLISPTPVFGEINGLLKAAFFHPQTFFFCWFLTFLTPSASSFPFSLLSFPILSLCRLIAHWYHMLRTAVSSPAQLFESSSQQDLAHLPLLMYSLVFFPTLFQGSSSFSLLTHLPAVSAVFYGCTEKFEASKFHSQHWQSNSKSAFDRS